MGYSMQLDGEPGEDQTDDEIRRQLGWYLVPGNCNAMNHDIDTVDRFIEDWREDV